MYDGGDVDAHVPQFGVKIWFEVCVCVRMTLYTASRKKKRNGSSQFETTLSLCMTLNHLYFLYPYTCAGIAGNEGQRRVSR